MFDASQKRLVQSLEEAARVFRDVGRPAPPVVVINQMPPSQPSPAWHQDLELSAVGAAVIFFTLVLLVGGCLWLRRYRPASWGRVKAGGWRAIKWLALPLSWLCGRAAAIWRHLHQSVEAASTSTDQVSKTEFSFIYVGNWYSVI